MAVLWFVKEFYDDFRFEYIYKTDETVVPLDLRLSQTVAQMM